MRVVRQQRRDTTAHQHRTKPGPSCWETIQPANVTVRCQCVNPHVCAPSMLRSHNQRQSGRRGAPQRGSTWQKAGPTADNTQSSTMNSRHPRHKGPAPQSQPTPQGSPVRKPLPPRTVVGARRRNHTGRHSPGSAARQNASGSRVLNSLELLPRRRLAEAHSGSGSLLRRLCISRA